jgi:hypothetical protein
VRRNVGRRFRPGWNDLSVVPPSPVVQGFSYLDYGARGFIAIR